MFIAFEGPDNVGKSTSAANLATSGEAIYNITKEQHAALGMEISQKGKVVTYDRIDWLSHMVYRLALPDREWNDARPRTVFAMPDTHLVVKIHHPDMADFTADEVVDTPISRVNPMYYYQADFLMHLNAMREFSLFKTVSIIEVFNDQNNGTYHQQLMDFSSPVFTYGTAAQRMVHSDESLLELLRYEEQQRV